MVALPTGGSPRAGAAVRELIEVEGHIIDSLILAKVMDVTLAAGADYRRAEVEIGKPFLLEFVVKEGYDFSRYFLEGL